MKRTFFLLTLLLVVTANTWAQKTFRSGNFICLITNEVNSEVEIYNSDTTAVSVDIPLTVVDKNGERYNVTSIGDNAFRSCYSLTQITIPNSVTSIGDDAFSFCTSLTQITIPNSVTSIGDNAFNCCQSLTQITIPNSVTSIGNDAFLFCTSLTQITIPNSVTSIGNKAFYGCSSLKSVFLNNGLKEIGDNAFFSCNSLPQITIPSSVTSFGKQLFSISPEFKKMTVLATVPPTVTDETFSTYANIQVYVPAEALEAYKAAEGWKNLKLNALTPQNKTVNRSVGFSAY